MDFYGFEQELDTAWEAGNEEGYEETERDLVDQFEEGGNSYSDDDDPMDSVSLGLALGFADEMTVGNNKQVVEDLFDLTASAPEMHEEAVSLKSRHASESRDPFFTYVKETCAGTRSLSDFITAEERREWMRKEFV